MKATGPSIKDPESIDLPSSWKKQKSSSDRVGTIFWRVTVWVLLIAGSVVFFNVLFSEGIEIGREYISREVETSRVLRPTSRATPTMSAQDLILTYKVLLRSQLREEGMLLGECGTFRCSKRWNDYMDAEIMRLIGR